MKNKSIAKNALSYLFIIGVVLISTIILILYVGADIPTAFSSFFKGIVGSRYSIGEVFVKAIPLTLAGLGVAVAFNSGLVNLGAEGQLYMGAIGGTIAALYLDFLPKPLLILVCILIGFIFGGIWSLIPGILKSKYGISEVINTLMFNYIAIYIVGVLVRTVLQNSENSFPMTNEFGANAQLPLLLSGTRLHFGIVIALIACLLIWILLWKTRSGFEMRAVGENPRAAHCSGISVGKNVVLAAVISGGLAGIAGVCEVTGIHHKLLEGISPDYGYLAVIVALLGGNKPVGVIIAAFGLAILQVGSLSMQRAAGVPTSISTIILAIVVILVLAKAFISKFFVKKRMKGKEV